ncbi:GrpB family protein [Streptomyces sp. NPDC049879]|uniref:GrpB family protein n=1 Tax=Streptomyces sp. NPDC049879 TaxID=3365598 RepID=UPI0037AF9282
MSIEISEYDPRWPARAALAVEELRAVAPGLFAEIEHVGSTSVPGLAAKPVIDLMACVERLDDVTPEREAAIASLGYRREDAGMPDRIFFPRDDAAGVRTHHLHVVLLDGWPTRNQRLLRDHLRAHPEAAGEYAALKRGLAAGESDGMAYTRGKTALIQRLVDRERAARGLPLVSVWEE